MSELKLCPFCGNCNVEFHDEGGFEFVSCRACGSCGPDGNGKGEAVSRWNKRAKPPAPQGE